MNRILKNIIFTLVLALLWGGCQKEWEEPQFTAPTYQGPAPNKTIQDIKNKHLILDSYKLDSICSYDEIFIVEAVVVSTDEGGNFYKSMVVQDETGAIEIQLDMNGLFNLYPVGQKVIIDCRGLIVGDYNRYYQVGWEYRKTSVGRINALHFNRYIHRVGLPSKDNLPTPLLGTEIDMNSLEDVGKLVKLENCQFAPESWGKPFSYNEFVTEHTLNVQGVSKPIVVRTSNYARFRSLKVPSGVGTLYGILTIYDNNYQLMIRTRDDIQFAQVDTPEDEVFYSYQFNENSIGPEGWSVFPANATRWRFVNFGGDQFMYHDYNTSNIEMDDWLISPPIEIDATKESFVRLLHKMNLVGLQEYYSLYYTTNVDQPFDPDNYAPLPAITQFPSEFSNSNDITLPNLTASKVRIALRYNNHGGNPSGEWRIKKIELINK